MKKIRCKCPKCRKIWFRETDCNFPHVDGTLWRYCHQHRERFFMYNDTQADLIDYDVAMELRV